MVATEKEREENLTCLGFLLALVSYSKMRNRRSTKDKLGGLDKGLVLHLVWLPPQYWTWVVSFFPFFPFHPLDGYPFPLCVGFFFPTMH